MRDGHRQFKDRLYAQFARLGKALSNPHRLEMLDLLAQGERTVDSLATELGVSVANASQHLQVLRHAALVESRRDGLFVHYRLADLEVFDLSKVIRSVAERRLAELERLVNEHFGNRATAEAVPMDELLKRARSKQVVILDTRPASEYLAGHIPGSLSIPVDDLQRRLNELTKSRNTWRIAAVPIASTPIGRSRFSAPTAVVRDGWSRDFRNGGPPDSRCRKEHSQAH